jgi:hypothetical protein
MRISIDRGADNVDVVYETAALDARASLGLLKQDPI